MRFAPVAAMLLLVLPSALSTRLPPGFPVPRRVENPPDHVDCTFETTAGAAAAAAVDGRAATGEGQAWTGLPAVFKSGGSAALFPSLPATKLTFAAAPVEASCEFLVAVAGPAEQSAGLVATLLSAGFDETSCPPTLEGKGPSRLFRRRVDGAETVAFSVASPVPDVAVFHQPVYPCYYVTAEPCSEFCTWNEESGQCEDKPLCE
eukprot:gene9406-14584_t